jgi:UDP-2-acetamido-3-amino-2,3-dideoxy-glucuronate N-acetyltransferase
MMGVPAMQRGWMSRHGHRLVKLEGDGSLICPESGWHYRELEPGELKCLDWPENKPLEAT